MTNASESLNTAQEAMAKVGTVLAMVVDDALSPALLPYRDGTGEGFVRACEHAPLGDEARDHDRTATPLRTDRNAYLCPMHPERLLCDHGTCIEDHLRAEHWRDPLPPRCFQCERPVEDDFVPVFAEITLHRNVNVSYDCMPGHGVMSLFRAYGGVLLTLPVTYLCGLHAGLVEVPLRMGWPMGKG